MRRHLRLYAAFIRMGLMKEMSFRANFLVRVVTRLLWVILLCVFYDVIYTKTTAIGDWTKFQFLVLLGTHFIVVGIVETFFMPNFSELADKVRTGKLDFALSKPVDEQFLLTLQDIDWANATNVLYGLGMVIYSLAKLDQAPSGLHWCVYLILVLAGVTIFYSIMTILAVTAVWLIRNQHLYEMWFYVSVFSRFPPEIFPSPLQFILRYMLPVLIVVAVPAESLSKGLFLPDKEWLPLYSLAIAAGFLWLSRKVFRGTLRHYRSASS